MVSNVDPCFACGLFATSGARFFLIRFRLTFYILLPLDSLIFPSEAKKEALGNVFSQFFHVFQETFPIVPHISKESMVSSDLQSNMLPSSFCQTQ